MNPLLQLLQQLIGNGSFPGIPSSFNPAIAEAFNLYKNFQMEQDKSRQYDTNTDVMKDIEAYRVNPHRGYLAKHGGFASSGLMLASLVPFNLPGKSLIPHGVEPIIQSLPPILPNMIGMTSGAKMKQGGVINNTGYTPGTGSFNNPFNIIPGNKITMKNTPFPIMAISDNGILALLQPGMTKAFKGAKSVLEIPLMQWGGQPGVGIPGADYANDWQIQAAQTAQSLVSQIPVVGQIFSLFAGNPENRARKMDDRAAYNLYSSISKKAGVKKKDMTDFAEFRRKLESGEIVNPLTYTDEQLQYLKNQGGGHLYNPGFGVGAAKGVNISQMPGYQNPGTSGQGFNPQYTSTTYNPTGSLFNMINQSQTQVPVFGFPPAFFGQQTSGQGTVAPNVPPPQTNSNSLGALTQLLQGAVPGPFGGVAGGLDINNLSQTLTTLLPMLQNNQPAPGKYGGYAKKKKRKYQLGGFGFETEMDEDEMEMVPIQAEKIGKQPEMIVHLDNTITPVNAKKPHSKMDEDEITDIIPQASYIASADKNMKLSWKEADEIVIAVKTQSYEEKKQGKIPEFIKLSSLWPDGNKSDKTFAELMEIVAKKFPTVDRSDIFTKQTNQSNINSRTPYIAHLIRLNEEKKLKMNKNPNPIETLTPQFQYGGLVKKYQKGNWVSDISSLATTLGPLLGGLFGGGKGGGNMQSIGQVPQWLQTAMMSTVPMYQTGINQNIAAQSGALNQGIQDFSALANKLISDAQASASGQNFANLGTTGLSALNALGTETTLPRLDLGASRSRILNYQPTSASRAAVDALATPRYDTRAILQELGTRGGSVLAQLESERQRNINAAALQRSQIVDQANLNKINQLNAIDQTEQPFNIQQQEKERILREQRRLGLTGSLSQGLQRGADINTGLLGQIGNIQSQTLPITTQFALQNAGLQGQNLMLGAQNAFNAYSGLGSLLSGNQLAQYLQNNQPTPTVPGTNPTTPPSNTGVVNCPSGQMKNKCGNCVDPASADSNGCLPGESFDPVTQLCVC